MTWPEVDEGPAVESQTSAPDEADWVLLLSAELVDLDEMFSVEIVCENNHVKIRDKIGGDRSLVDVDMDVRIQLFELAQGGLSSGLMAHVALSGIEVSAEIWSSHDG